jgi:hypothetical protein
MLKTMLSASPELDFVDELFLFCPRWLHPDLESLIERCLGPLGDDTDRQALAELLFSGRPYGWVWSRAAEKFDRDVLERELANGPLDMKRVFDALMAAHAARSGKSGRGAKFPMHYSESARLLQWYPDCRLVHTTRDPRAVYASQANKYISESDPGYARAWMKFRQFAHINLQVSWTARLHRELAGHPNYRLVRYEDVVRDPETRIRELCEFLGVEFLPEMLAPNQYGSSFGTIRGSRGVDASSLNAWRSRIHPLTAASLRSLHPSAWRRFGYDR